jgi:hypothetical protein
VAKLDTSSGSVTWAVSAGGTTTDDLTRLAVDASGTVYVAGTTMSDPLKAGSYSVNRWDGP